MEQIARQAGVSKRTLYKYFPAKEALLERLLEAALAQDLAQREFSLSAEVGFRASVTDLLQESAQWCEQHRDLLLPYIRYKFASFDPAAASAEDRGLLPVWTTLIAAGQDRGELRSSHSADSLGSKRPALPPVIPERARSSYASFSEASAWRSVLERTIGRTIFRPGSEAG